MTIRSLFSSLGRALTWPFRRWRWFLLLFIACVIALTIADQVLLRQLAQQREDMVAAGGKASLAEYALNLNERDNAATVYRYAAGKVWKPADSPVDPEELGGRYVGNAHPACGGESKPRDRDREMTGPLSPEEETRLSEYLQQNEPVYGLLLEAAAKPGCQIADYAAAATSAEPAQILPDLAFMRDLARLTAARAVWEARHENPEQACVWLQQTVHLANALKDEPLLIAGLVRAAILGLANEAAWGVVCANAVPQALPPGLLQELDIAVRRELWAKVYDGERCFSNEVSQKQFMAMGRIFRPLILEPNQLRINRMTQDIMRCVREDRYDLRTAEKTQLVETYDHAEPAPWKPWRVLCDILAPAMVRSMSSMERAIAQGEAIRILIRLGSFHSEHAAYPDTLEALQSASNESLPEDPFSGKPFAYRAQGNGFLLYSVGEDRNDDGGKPAEKRGPGDIVWCVSP